MNIAFDSHKRYTLCSVAADDGKMLEEVRIDHTRGAIRDFLSRYPAGESVAVETIGNWYWIVDEIEAAGLKPLLVHARKAKVMMGCINKTDRLDVRGLNRLQQAGTLPTVWIPPGELRDQRDLPRTRMVLVAQRTCLKNRIHSTLEKYALSLPAVKDIFGKKCRSDLRALFDQLPEHTSYTARDHLVHIEHLDATITALDKRIEDVFSETAEIRLLQTMPGIGKVLSLVVSLEVGDIARFPSPQALASYAGTVPRVHASGGRVRYGKTRPDVNRYLKWAYSEAANALVANSRFFPDRHVIRIYGRVKRKRGHQTAIGAMSRHLAEATFWMLKKKEPYKDPSLRQTMSTSV